MLKLALYQSPDPIFHEAMSNSLRTVHESLETLYSMPLLPNKNTKSDWMGPRNGCSCELASWWLRPAEIMGPDWSMGEFSIRDMERLRGPVEGEGGGTKPTCRIPLFLLGNRGIVIQPLKRNFKVTCLNKPWVLVRKYLELSAGMRS